MNKIQLIEFETSCGTRTLLGVSDLDRDELIIKLCENINNAIDIIENQSSKIKELEKRLSEIESEMRFI